VFISKLLQVKWADGKKFEDKFMETLEKYGYRGSYMSKEWLKQPAFVQSFAPSALVYVSNLTDLPTILLIDDVTILTEDTNQFLFPHSGNLIDFYNVLYHIKNKLEHIFEVQNVNLVASDMYMACIVNGKAHIQYKGEGVVYLAGELKSCDLFCN
jgi:hypothetical protein